MTSAVRDTMTKSMLTTKLNAIAVSNSGLPDFPFAQQDEDGISERHRAQREFLALVDVVLDEDAALGVVDA